LFGVAPDTGCRARLPRGQRPFRSPVAGTRAPDLVVPTVGSTLAGRRCLGTHRRRPRHRAPM